MNTRSIFSVLVTTGDVFVVSADSLADAIAFFATDGVHQDVIGAKRASRDAARHYITHGVCILPNGIGQSEAEHISAVPAAAVVALIPQDIQNVAAIMFGGSYPTWPEHQA